MNDRLTQLQKLYDADPNDAFVTYGIAMEHRKAQAHVQAIAWLDRTIEIDRHYHYAYFQKAKALSELGRDQQAKQTLGQGIAAARETGDEKAIGELSELMLAL